MIERGKLMDIERMNDTQTRPSSTKVSKTIAEDDQSVPYSGNMWGDADGDESIFSEILDQPLVECSGRSSWIANWGSEDGGESFISSSEKTDSISSEIFFQSPADMLRNTQPQGGCDPTMIMSNFEGETVVHMKEDHVTQTCLSGTEVFKTVAEEYFDQSVPCSGNMLRNEDGSESSISSSEKTDSIFPEIFFQSPADMLRNTQPQGGYDPTMIMSNFEGETVAHMKEDHVTQTCLSGTEVSKTVAEDDQSVPCSGNMLRNEDGSESVFSEILCQLLAECPGQFSWNMWGGEDGGESSILRNIQPVPSTRRVITQEVREAIKSILISEAKTGKQLSTREIFQQLTKKGIYHGGERSLRSVVAALRKEMGVKNSRQPQSRVVTPAVREAIKSILISEAKTGKQLLTREIFQQLTEKGIYHGSKYSIYKVVAALRKEMKVKNPRQPHGKVVTPAVREAIKSILISEAKTGEQLLIRKIFQQLTEKGIYHGSKVLIYKVVADLRKEMEVYYAY